MKVVGKMLGKVEKKFINIGGRKPLIWENLPETSIIRRRDDHYLDVVLNEKEKKRLCVQKWYWPNGARSFFSFRADMDAGNEESLLCFLKSIAPWSKSLSLFVCGKAYIGKEPLLQKVAELGAEVGNHTYTHYVFSRKDRNRKNLELVEQILAHVDIQPRGYVGPASFFHTSMYDVLEEKAYDYTSSFGLAHDDFPFFPPKNDTETYKMVEIPFHCLGDRFPKFGLELDSNEVWTFFEKLIEKKYHNCEPMFIYGHPDMPGRMGDHPDLVKRICKKALAYDDVVTGNMADIAAWWRRRDAATATIQYDEDKQCVVATDYQGSPDVYWSIQVSEGCKYIVSGEDIQKGVSLNSLQKYKKIDLMNTPYANVGEVVDALPEKLSIRAKVGRWRRELRRKKRMIRELDTANI